MLATGLKSLKSAYWKTRCAIIPPCTLDRVKPEYETSNLIAALDIPNIDVMEISGNRDHFRHLDFRSYISADYPEFNICFDVLDRKFDLIIAEQVFEHLLWPYKACRNVHQMLKPGGHFLISTPFLQKVHNYPVDCSRWTETGLKYLLAEGGFPLEKIKTGSWGNRMAARANINARRDRFPMYNPLLHWNLQNDPIYPVQVWALAQA